MGNDQHVVIGGGGGFIGGHLAADLVGQGYTNNRCVDIKPFDQWHQVHNGLENLQLDLSEKGELL